MDENKINEENLINETNEINEDIKDETTIEEPIIQELMFEEKPVYENKQPEPKKKKTFRGSLISYIALALVASLIGGLASAYIGPTLYGKSLPYPNNREYVAQAISINTNDDVNTVSAVVAKSMSSVVGITTVETQQYFFTAPQDVTGVGSGVIVDSNGYILTNAHVVGNGNAKDIKVLFENGEKVQGTLIWMDPEIDVAMIKVDVKNLPVATLGDSDKLLVGEIAIAIGNPLGLDFQRTVTSGIISGLHRSVQIDQSTIIEGLIQTDASINPGNSGGPLLNGKGEVIGINTAKVKSAEGLGFSIPINQIKPIVSEVVKNGTFRTVLMGITGVSVEEYEARLGVKLSADRGIVIIEVQVDSAAEKAGILSGDIITKIDDKELLNMRQLRNSLFNYKQGDKASLTIKRNNQDVKLEITFTNLK